MRSVGLAGAGALAVCSALAAQVVTGDARRGEQLFQSEQCVQCHSVSGRGGTVAPDLTRRIDRDYTPAVMASLMWNHAPEMWAGMKKQGIVAAELSPGSAADLFAFFVSARYFDRPGDAGRGKQLFASKHCAECHGVTASNAAGAPPVVKWESLADPVALAQQMWDHAGQMREAFAKRNIAWVQLSGQELADILVYLRNLPEAKNVSVNFQLSASDGGAALFQSKGCVSCHTGKLAMENLLRNQALTDIAASMWNHEPQMKQPVALSQAEMRQILGYVWTRQYFRGEGSASRGRRVFEEKHCAGCHGDRSSGAPSLARGKGAYSDVTMVSALWGHGPRMQATMEQKRIAWPSFTAQQMTDLIAYLNSL
jgi:mono/diheme cytochrome c family protein